MIDIDFLMFLTLIYVISSFNSTGKSIHTTTVHPLDIASSINLWPSRIFPLTAKKRLFYSYGNGFSFERFEQKKIHLECKKKTKLGEIHAVSNSSKPSEEEAIINEVELIGNDTGLSIKLIIALDHNDAKKLK